MTTRKATMDRRRELFNEATTIVEEEYADDLELEAIARRIAASRRQLQRAFAEVGDTSFRLFLAEVRMRRAAELLSGSSMPVREVASSVGYRQPAQFAKAFRRHRGTPPSSFRRAGQPLAA